MYARRARRQQGTRHTHLTTGKRPNCLVCLHDISCPLLPLYLYFIIVIIKIFDIDQLSLAVQSRIVLCAFGCFLRAVILNWSVPFKVIGNRKVTFRVLFDAFSFDLFDLLRPSSRPLRVSQLQLDLPVHLSARRPFARTSASTHSGAAHSGFFVRQRDCSRVAHFSSRPEVVVGSRHSRLRLSIHDYRAHSPLRVRARLARSRACHLSLLPPFLYSLDSIAEQNAR